jgi:hypothetical protein
VPPSVVRGVCAESGGMDSPQSAAVHGSDASGRGGWRACSDLVKRPAPMGVLAPPREHDGHGPNGQVVIRPLPFDHARVDLARTA